MKIYNLFLLCTLLSYGMHLSGQSYVYSNQSNVFTVSETATEYQVDCASGTQAPLSKNKNILDRKLRLVAIDLIGTYLLFRDCGKEDPDLFQPYADEVNLHYNAFIKDFKQEFRQQHQQETIRYSCKKENYHLETATYHATVDWPDLLYRHYQRRKDETAARLLYQQEPCTAATYLLMQKDYLTGQSRVEDPQPETNPYRTFSYEELVTQVPQEEKAAYYDQWLQSLQPDHTLWENLLTFCAAQRIPVDRYDSSLAEIIMAYPGALSPYGLPPCTNSQIYPAAAKAFSQQHFEETIRLLSDPIATDGISAQSLSLLGSAHRYQQHPERAIGFLLLCFKLQPNTTFLAGNLALTLHDLQYPRLKEICRFLLTYAQDPWSKQEIQQLLENK